MEIRNKLLEAFKDIDFIEETHSYYLNGEQLPSVSSLLKHFYEEFDSYNIGLRYAEKMGLRPEDVWKSWEGTSKIATDKGHRVHTFAENYANWRYFGIGQCPEVTCKQTLGVIQFFNSFPSWLNPAATELQMYNEEYGYSGTADLPLQNDRTNKLLVTDYKSNLELFDESKPLLYHIDPSYGLRQDNYGKYCLQFSFYQLLLELKGFEVEDRVLIWLNEDKENKKLYRTYRTPDLSKEILKHKHIWSPVYKNK